MSKNSLLRVPLFYKLTLANAGVVVLAALLSQILVLRAAPELDTRSLTGIIGGSAAIAVALGILVNAALVRVALGPLRQLEETARAVSAGHLDARAGTSPLADRDLEELMTCFDQMLDSVQRNRNRERGLAYRLVESEERTRRGIAKDLYDDTAQRLATILLYAPRIRSAGNGVDPDRVADRLRDDLTDTLEGVRATARRLRPPELDELGVCAALQAEARLVSRRSGIPVVVEQEGDLPTLSRPSEVTLFRLVQELLTESNAVGGEDGIRVLLVEREGDLECRVRAGRQLLQDTATGSAGLDALNERASWIGGEVALDDDPDGGQSVRIRVPANLADDDRFT